MALLPTGHDPNALNCWGVDTRLRRILPDFPLDPERERAFTIELRDTLIREGGYPTRPIQFFEPSQGHHETLTMYDAQHSLCEVYFNERMYWRDEFEFWRGFLQYRAALDQPSPTLKDLSKVEILTECIAYQRKRIYLIGRTQTIARYFCSISKSDWEKLRGKLHALQQQLDEAQHESKRINKSTRVHKAPVRELRRSARLVERAKKKKAGQHSIPSLRSGNAATDRKPTNQQSQGISLKGVRRSARIAASRPQGVMKLKHTKMSVAR